MKSYNKKQHRQEFKQEWWSSKRRMTLMWVVVFVLMTLLVVSAWLFFAKNHQVFQGRWVKRSKQQLPLEDPKSLWGRLKAWWSKLAPPWAKWTRLKTRRSKAEPPQVSQSLWMRLKAQASQWLQGPNIYYMSIIMVFILLGGMLGRRGVRRRQMVLDPHQVDSDASSASSDSSSASSDPSSPSSDPSSSELYMPSWSETSESFSCTQSDWFYGLPEYYYDHSKSITPGVFCVTDTCMATPIPPVVSAECGRFVRQKRISASKLSSGSLSKRPTTTSSLWLDASHNSRLRQNNFQSFCSLDESEESWTSEELGTLYQPSPDWFSSFHGSLPSKGMRTQIKICTEDLKSMTILGKGSNANVYCYDLPGYPPLCFKHCLWTGADAIPELMKEWDAMSTLSSIQGVPRAFAMNFDPLGIVMTRHSSVNLYEMAQCKVPQDQMLCALVKLCEILDQIHSFGLLHNDIHERNVTVSFGSDGDTDVTVIDFGAVTKIGEKPNIFSSATSTYDWRKELDRKRLYPFYAPEVFHGGVATVASDVYSLATTIKFVLTLNGHPSKGQLQKLLQRALRSPDERPSVVNIKESISLDLKAWQTNHMPPPIQDPQG